MRDEELLLRFFAFHIHGVDSYRTPQKLWLNDAAKDGKKYSKEKIANLYGDWKNAIDVCLRWFGPLECFRRIPVGKSRAINRALFDLTMVTAVGLTPDDASRVRDGFRQQYQILLQDAEFIDLISRAVDHKSRTQRRFVLWNSAFGGVFE